MERSLTSEELVCLLYFEKKPYVYKNWDEHLSYHRTTCEYRGERIDHCPLCFKDFDKVNHM